MSNTPTTTNSTVHAIKKLATAAAIAGALGLAALGMANGTAAAAPADDSGSTTSAASEQAGPSSPSAGPSSPSPVRAPSAGPASATGDSGDSADPSYVAGVTGGLPFLEFNSAPTAGQASKTTHTPTSTVGNGRQPGDSADDTSIRDTDPEAVRRAQEWESPGEKQFVVVYDEDNDNSL